MKDIKQYWNGLEEYQNTPEFQNSRKKEFEKELPLEDALNEESLGLKSNRRDFLKIFGFGLTAAALAACQQSPVKKAIPYVIKPENVTPGVASWYASTCRGCAAGCGILVKTREGRPIKIEGNPNNPISLSGTCAIGQSTVLSLYDHARLKNPQIKGEESTWRMVNGGVDIALKEGGKVRVLTGTINSPLTEKVIHNFLAQFGDAKHIQYDAVSSSAIATASKNNFGEALIPTYKFENADVIVSFNADFLGSWISPVEYTKGYSKKRKVNRENPNMSKHFHFEGNVSLTGTNADLRLPIDPTEEGKAILSLYNEIASALGESGIPNVPSISGDLNKQIQASASALLDAKGKSLVLCGTNDVARQEVINAINYMLGNYGKTVDIENHSHQARGSDEEMMNLVNEMKAGSVSTLIMIDVNPVYDFSGDFAAALAKVPNTVSISERMDETTSLVKFQCAATHAMESWNVIEARKGYFSVQQPTIRPIFNSVQAEDLLMGWTPMANDNVGGGDSTATDAGNMESMTCYDAMRMFWDTKLFPTQTEHGTVDAFWEASLKRGGYLKPGGTNASNDAIENEEGESGVLDAGSFSSDLSSAAATISSEKGSGVNVVVFSSVGLRDGKLANSPWLQELPDPITKITWDNAVLVSFQMCQAEGWEDGDMVEVKSGSHSVTLPVVVQPGIAPNTVAISLGYGRANSGRVSDGIGANAYPFVNVVNGSCRYENSGSITATGESDYVLAKTQYHVGYDLELQGGPVGGIALREEIEERIDNSIVKETTLEEYKSNKFAGNTNRAHIQHENSLSLWDEHEKPHHHWAMSVDLNSCTGCGNCIVSCHAENNVPMVGKTEVATRREMHWMRIDRYFRGDPGATDGSLETVHQPVMCQHCDNAPCETVCPVLATVHSDEGLNQQAYNRCVGTRYCANNCPYKVRRFNWFSYYDNEKWNNETTNSANWIPFDDVGKMVLNPDVTVRARGVMEKCSFCSQRLQEGKLKAKVEGRPTNDEDFKVACQQSCPADAIQFGNLNDADSEVNKLYFDNERTFQALEEVKTLPSVSYMTKVRNKPAPEKEVETHTEAETEEHGA